jgi:DMSO/TMAO reductase YedYZ molybdopterin-dependent catalytic subunit
MDIHSRRDLLKGSLALAGLAFLDLPSWALPALADGETDVPFIDIPATFTTTPSPTSRFLDLRKIAGPLTPADQFFTTQHYGHPEVDPATFRLKVTGLVGRPLALKLEDLRRMAPVRLTAGFECSGNSRRPIEGLVSNGEWTGVPLRAVLERAALAPGAREIVFFGADHGEEEVEFRTQKFKVDQQFGRSLQRDRALAAGPIVAWALNGEPLTRPQGAPLRLIVPGWYGVANVKWLSQIHAQEEEYLGKFQARWYRTLRGETIDGEVKWKETAVSRMQLKSVIARVTRQGAGCKVRGFALNDGTPLKLVEIKVDDGPWRPAAFDPATAGKYSWKLFSWTWTDPTPGEHTLVSRVTDANGAVQPTVEDLETKKTFLEDNSQFPRRVQI